MWEFFTEWSSDDPKYYVVFIVLGSLLCLMSRKVVQKDEFEVTDIWYWSQFIAGALLIFYGVFAIIWDLTALI